MKILYLNLKNFATILSAMKRREIKIDFSKSTNRIILLVGENGTGKTSILSQLHPFATSGNMDVRSDKELIIDGKDGYKEIHIQHDEDMYVIKHFYIHSTSKGVSAYSNKSYISKNGIEMNPNGNVTSFKEITECELSLTQEYLKLLRLGTNVINFLKMKASERKNFAADLLSDIDIYTKYYKKISEDSRVIKSLLRSVTDKIYKLHITDIDEENKKLSELVNNLDKEKDNRSIINKRIGIIEGTIRSIIPLGIADLWNNINTARKEAEETKNYIEVINASIKKLGIVLYDDVDKIISKTTDKLVKAQTELTTNTSMINFYFSHLDTLYDQKDDKEKNLKQFASDMDYERVNELYLQLHRDKEKYQKKFKDFKVTCSREEMLSAMVLLQEIEKIISEIHEFDLKAVDTVVEYFKNRVSIDLIVKQNVSRIDNKISRLNRTLSNISATLKPTSSAYVMFDTDNCTDSCPYRRFYEDVTGHTDKETSKKDIRTELSVLEVQREFYLLFPDIAKKIEYILLLIKTNKKLVDKMPEKFFDIKKLFICIQKSEAYYNEDHMTEYVNKLEDYEKYLSIDNQLKDVTKERSLLKRSTGGIDSIQSDIQRIDTEINDVEEKQKQCKEKCEYLKDRVDVYAEFINSCKLYSEYKSHHDNLKIDYNAKLNEIGKYREQENKISSYIKDKEKSVSELVSIEKKIKDIEEQIELIRFNLMQFKSFQKEKKELDDKFDDINIIKEALSSNKGIPLLFIQLYLRNTRIMVNQLLETVYNGSLEIEEFIINDKEFRIPYNKNGLIINDVVKCSQGEESFISLALSFALIEQSIKDYNIMLLDEMDSPLDTGKRYAFLPILEKQLDSINAEQVFLITHNNVFDNYPVDIIKTSDVNIDNYKNTNVLFSA